MNTQPASLIVAGTAIAVYMLLCWIVWRSARARRRATAASSRPAVSSGPCVLVVHASQTGTAESLAEQTANALRSTGIEVELCSISHLQTARIKAAHAALFVVSTYGEGDPPDAAAGFVAGVMQEGIDLSGLRFGLLMLGDRSYRNYCGFGRQLDEWLRERGAVPLFSPVDVDKGDPQALQRWRQELGQFVTDPALIEWQDEPFEAWVLRARQLLNPGSCGGAVYHLALTRQDGAPVHWQSGDLLQIEVPADPGRPRDYSIASVPQEGAVHLLVRLGMRPDGTPGLASGWLTRELELGAVVQARLRAHSQFRLGENVSRDLILIGNGTGLAGLRAHLKHCELAGVSPPARHWLIFGERQAAYDAFYANELCAWQASGLITRLDLVYSRDGGAHRYVQDRLRSQSGTLREWIQAGGAIYVCGSLKGMAQGVELVLSEVLGDSTLTSLQQQGRYRRDVY